MTVSADGLTPFIPFPSPFHVVLCNGRLAQGQENLYMWWFCLVLFFFFFLSCSVTDPYQFPTPGGGFLFLQLFILLPWLLNRVSHLSYHTRLQANENTSM